MELSEKIKQIILLPRMYYLPAEQNNNNCKGLYDMMKEISKPDFTMVEIGSFAGVSSMLFAEMCSKVFCVDRWIGYSEVDIQKVSLAELKFNQVCKQYANISKMKMDSVTAAGLFQDASLDIVYIDGGHDYDSVITDLVTWIPKIKKGGWITGHDIDIDVRIAVEEIIGTNYKTYTDSSWAKQL